MKLVEIEYLKNNKPIKRLFILIEETATQYLCIASDHLSIGEIEAIKQNIRLLRDWPLKDKVRWLKFNIPSYKKAYRTPNKSHAKLLRTYES